MALDEDPLKQKPCTYNHIQPHATTYNLTSSAGSSFLPWDEAAYSHALVKPRLSSKNLGMRLMKAWE